MVGVDPPGSTTSRILRDFPVQTLPVTAGEEPLSFPRHRPINVPRTLLQEDAGLGDADEIRCRIQIRAIGLPTTITEGFTDEAVLVG